VYVGVVSFFALLIIAVLAHSRRQYFQVPPLVMAIASSGMLMLKNISCLLTIVILILQHNAGMNDDLAGILFLIILTSVSVCFSLVSIKVALGIAYFRYAQDVKIGKTPEGIHVPDSKELFAMRVIESNSVLISGVITDLPIAIIQLEALVVREAYSRTVIMSMAMLLFSIGGALKMLAVSSLLCECLEKDKIPIMLNLTSKMKLHCAFNPCYTAKQLFSDVYTNKMANSESNECGLVRGSTFQEIEERLSGIVEAVDLPCKVSILGSKEKSL